MDWCRSFPRDLPGDRAYVCDQLPRAVMDGDYRAVLPLLRHHPFLLEWDIAVSLGDREQFERHARLEPGRVHVAPYRLYPRSTALEEPVWSHRIICEGNPMWIPDGYPTADLFSFGMIYIPAAVVDEFLRNGPAGPVTDSTFSWWHHRAGYGPAAVHWNVIPVHLHY